MVRLYCYWIFLCLRLKKELLRFICFILLLLDIPNRILLVVQYGLKVFVTQFGFEL